MNSFSELPFAGPELCQLEAYEAVDLLKRGEVSSNELLAASFARIAQVEPAINAIPTLCEARAFEASASLDRSSGDHAGWLGGLPISIKDLTPVKGVRTTFGTKGFADFIPEESDPLVERLEERGAIVVGKTNTPELGAGGNTYNEVFGPTLNPWNTTLNAGGSSGGAAASLATGEVWLSHGSDHAGSLRTPAAYCGIVGLRPSPGRAGASSKNMAYFTEPAQGPMARSVRDCALFLDAMAGFEPRYPTSYPAPDQSFQEAVLRADGKLRIAFSLDFNGAIPVDDEMEIHLRGALTVLERNGAVVEEFCPDLSYLDRTYHTLRGMLWATITREMPLEITRHFKATLAQNNAQGQALVMNDIADAELGRSTIYNNMMSLFENFDVLACPVVGCMPHVQSEEWVHEVGGVQLAGYVDWLRFSFLSTVTGLPAMSVPCGLGPRGLPVGLQLIGKPRGEAALLAAARAVEIACGGPFGPIDPNVQPVS